jgi:hypothetical protein
MHTLRAVALIEQALQLADAQFPGDALAEVCRCASWEEREAVMCIVHSRPELAGYPATSHQVMTALRQMVHGDAL